MLMKNMKLSSTARYDTKMAMHTLTQKDRIIFQWDFKTPL